MHLEEKTKDSGCPARPLFFDDACIGPRSPEMMNTVSDDNDLRKVS